MPIKLIFDFKLGHTYLKSCCSDFIYSKVGWLVGKKSNSHEKIASETADKSAICLK